MNIYLNHESALKNGGLITIKYLKHLFEVEDKTEILICHIL